MRDNTGEGRRKGYEIISNALNKRAVTSERKRRDGRGGAMLIYNP